MTESSTNVERQGDANEDRVLEHEYDGIREYDNPMPRWWVWSFWATFYVSLFYLFHYWVGNGASVAESYGTEMAAVQAARAKEAAEQSVSEESLGTMAADGATIEAGQGVFAARCVACHQERGEGNIGPNLTDNHWIHGQGSLMDIYHVVAQGVPDKGMPAWERQLSPLEMRQVVAFVGSIRNTNIPGKAPEGAPAVSEAGE